MTATCVRHRVPVAPAAPEISWNGSGSAAEDYLAQSIREPWAYVSPEFSPGSAGPRGAMPLLELSDAEVAAIVEYLLAG